MLDPRELWWPRFIVRLRDDRYVVAATAAEKDTTLPSVGAELLECDGRGAKTFVEQDLWPYAQGPMIACAGTARRRKGARCGGVPPSSRRSRRRRSRSIAARSSC
ncbi:MAG TPA: hypothetical protein VEO54_01945 [Thermoanaerobaculia bacterium]|nr:hypothetical protein [Thermoanaerobaculia bacterium]